MAIFADGPAPPGLHLLLRADCCLFFLRLRENLPERFGHTGASAMLIFLSRGDLFCRPLKREPMDSRGARAEADCLRVWGGFKFPRGTRSQGSKCQRDEQSSAGVHPRGGAQTLLNGGNPGNEDRLDILLREGRGAGVSREIGNLYLPMRGVA